MPIRLALLFLLALRLSAQTCPTHAPAPQYLVIFDDNDATCGGGLPCAIGNTVTFRLYGSTPLESCDSTLFVFGDGSPNVVVTGANQVVKHQYTKPGHFVVQATSSNVQGQTTFTYGIDIATSVYIANKLYYAFENMGKLNIPIQRNGSYGAATVHVTAFDRNQPQGGGHYVPKSQDITFAAGQKTATFSVDILNPDNDYTAWYYTFYVSIEDPLPDGYYVPSFYYRLVEVDMFDNDPYPRVTFNQQSQTVSEGAGNLVLDLTRSGDLRAFSIQYKVSDQNSPAVVGSTSGTINFAESELSKSFSIPLINDNVFNGDRSITVSLQNASTYVDSGFTTVKITDDEVPTTASIDDISVTEGDSGTTSANFHVTLNPPVSRATSVQWSTTAATAEAGTDFTASSGTLIIGPGEQTKTITVPLLGDTRTEQNEIFRVQIKSAGDPIIGKSLGVCTILNDDAGFTPSPVEMTRGSSRNATLIFARTAQSSTNVPLTSSAPGVASVPASVAVAAGKSSITVPITGTGPGRATIEATLPDSLGGKTVTLPVLVNAQPSLLFEPRSLELLTGATATVSLSISPTLALETTATLAIDDATIVSAPDSVHIAGSGSASIMVKGLAPGTATITASLLAGAAPATLPVVVRDVLGPKIDAIAPASGPTAGGTSVKITGERLAATCTVSFGGQIATSASFADGVISATAPAHDAGTVDVMVTCGGASDTLPASFTYYVPRRRTTR